MANRQWMAMVAAIAVVMIAGCSKKEEEKPPVIPSVPTVTATPSPHPTAAISQAPLASENIDAPQSFKPADDRDDRRFAALFPGSEKVDLWVKTSPVTGGEFHGKLPDYLPNLAAALAPFSGKTIATAKYQRTSGSSPEIITVTLIRAANTDDAYGMLSVSAPGLDQYKKGEVHRRPSGSEIYAVKGPYFGIFTGMTPGSSTVDLDHLAAGVELMAGKVLYEISDQAQVPRVVQYLQAEPLPPATVFFVRDLVSLKGAAGKVALDAAGLKDVGKLNKLLRLGPKVNFAVAVYTNPAWPGPDVVWLAEYPTREQTLDVAGQYRKILRKAKPGDRPDASTLLKGPKGRFLLGTWTLETESMTNPHIMNTIQTFLP